MDGSLSVSCGVGRWASLEKCVLGKLCIADISGTWFMNQKLVY